MISRQTVETRTDGLDTDYEALPDGWSAARLGDLVDDVQPGFACGSNNRDGLGVGHLRPMNISRGGRIDLSSLKYIPLSEAVGDARWVQCGDVVFNNTNSPELVGKTAYYDSTEPRAFSNHMTRIRCRVDRLEPRYCAVAMHQLWREGYFEAVCKNHVSQASVGRSVLLDAVISLPPLAEQRRIVTHVEALLARVNATRDRLAKVPLVMKRFRQAVLAAACSGRLTEDWREAGLRVESASEVLSRVQTERAAQRVGERGARAATTDLHLDVGLPDSWCWVTLEQLASDDPSSITDGPFGSNLKTSHYTENGPRVIRLQNVGDGMFVDSHAHISQEHYASLLKHKVNADDLVIAALGDPVPRACVIPPTVGPAIVKADCIRFRPHSELASSHYLNCALNAESTRARTSGAIHGVSRPRLNLGEIKQITVPLPPLSEQQEIVRCVVALFALANATEKRVQVASERADKLTQGMLAKAFRGELVPTDAELARQQDRETAPALPQRVDI